jgi:hypothetical protein
VAFPGIRKLKFQILRRTFSTLSQQHGTVKERATADAPPFGLGERLPAVKHRVAENCSGGCLSLAEVTGDPEVGSKPANI